MNIDESGELAREAALRKFRTVQTEGSREVARNVDFYDLDAIISVGYRVNSVRATQFRQWATGVLREFAIKGFVLDKKRLENSAFLNEDYFERLLAEIRENSRSEMMQAWSNYLDACVAGNVVPFRGKWA